MPMVNFVLRDQQNSIDRMSIHLRELPLYCTSQINGKDPKAFSTSKEPCRNEQWVRERQNERKREGRPNEITSNRKGLEGSLRPLLCMKASMSHPCVPLTARLPRTPHSHALLTVSWKQAERESPSVPITEEERWKAGGTREGEGEGGNGQRMN